MPVQLLHVRRLRPQRDSAMTQTRDYSGAGTALVRCIEGDYDAVRKIIGAMPVSDLQAIRQGCVDLDNEVNCLVETAASKPEGPRT